MTPHKQRRSCVSAFAIIKSPAGHSGSQSRDHGTIGAHLAWFYASGRATPVHGALPMASNLSRLLARTRASLTERYMRLPKLVRFLGEHLAFGAAIGVAFAALVLMSNISGIKDLIAESQNPYLAVVLLYAMNALTFASLSMGIAVMTMPMGDPCDMRDPEDRADDDDDEDKP